MLHAWPLDASQWDGQVAALSGRYRCLRPDFWGCGASGQAPGPVTIDGWATTLLELLDERGVGEVVVVGCSIGGYSTFALLRAAAPRIRGVVLANTRAAADDEATLAARRSQQEQVRSHGVEALVEPMTARLLCARCHGEAHISDPVRGRIRRCTNSGVLSAIEAIAARPDSRPGLSAITAPALVICGTADAVVPVEESRAMAAAIPRATVEEFEGAGHLCNVEQPQRFSASLMGFLDGL